MELNGVADQVLLLITTYGLGVVGAIAILIAGWTAAAWAARLVDRTLGRTAKLDPTLRGFFSSFTKYFVLAFTVLAVLSQFGVQTASLIAVFGAAGLAIGLALQGTLSNVAAGVMLLIFRPFKVGNYVEAGGQAGTIKGINLFITEFGTPDNVQILVPNSQIWGSAVKNYSVNTTRRIDLVVGIAYEDSIEQALALVERVANADDRVHKDPAPFVGVSELGDSSVNILVRLWCNASDYGGVKFGLTRALKECFDQAGISIPYPQRTVHLLQEKPTAAVAQ